MADGTTGHMQITAADTDPASSDRTRRLPILGRRRRFLLKPRAQIRLSVVASGIVLIALVVFNLTLYSATMRTAALVLENAPETAALVKAQDRIDVYVLVLLSSLFVLGTFVMGIVETHRTVGAAFNIERRLHEMENGNYAVRVRLRKGDQLRELETAVNRLGESLCGQTRSDVDVLEQLAGQVAEIAEARPLAARLHQLAEEKKALLAG